MQFSFFIYIFVLSAIIGHCRMFTPLLHRLHLTHSPILLQSFFVTILTIILNFSYTHSLFSLRFSFFGQISLTSPCCHLHLLQRRHVATNPHLPAVVSSPTTTVHGLGRNLTYAECSCASRLGICCRRLPCCHKACQRWSLPLETPYLLNRETINIPLHAGKRPD